MTRHGATRDTAMMKHSSRCTNGTSPFGFYCLRARIRLSAIRRRKPRVSRRVRSRIGSRLKFTQTRGQTEETESARGKLYSRLGPLTGGRYRGAETRRSELPCSE
jgi:hypothetical protein